MDVAEIRRAKLFNYIVFWIFVAFFVFLIVIISVYKYNRNFTTKKWLENPNDRYKIVNDMLSENEIVGMTEEEIINLLGEETENAPESFKRPRGEYPDENHLTYYTGCSFMDDEWLTITIENGIATAYVIGIT